MVTGRVVDYDAPAKTYFLPPEHALSLTSAAGPANMASMAQFVPLLGNVTDQLVDSFRNGGGVPYSAYPEFQGLMAEASASIHDVALVDVTLPAVPGIVERLEAGIEVADIGCGQGHSVNLMARAFPNSRFVGYDLSTDGVAAGVAEAAGMNLSNARFEVKDVATLDSGSQFDFVTAFDAIHDQAHPRKVLKGIHESLQPDGTFLCVDLAASSNLEDNMDDPAAVMKYVFSLMHCMTVSLALGGEGLGTMWGEQKAHELFAEAGFQNVTTHRIEGDNANNYYLMTR
jgi:SAM-dependent methyltransferase